MLKKTLFYAALFSCIFFVTCTKTHICPDPKPEPCLLPGLSNGLVAYFPFNGNVSDESGKGNNVIFNNATLTTDRNNNPNSAYQFNGVNSYMRIANSSALNPQLISICAIVKPTGFNSQIYHASAILYKGFQDQDLFNVYYMRFSDGPASTNPDPTNPAVDTMHQVSYGSCARNATDGKEPYVHTNKWYSLVYTYDGAVARFYIDGNLVSSVTGTGVYQTGDSDLFIGRTNNPSFPYWFNGVIDELRIYDRTLSSGEVKSFGSTCNSK